jgi:hypothetical protein
MALALPMLALVALAQPEPGPVDAPHPTGAYAEAAAGAGVARRRAVSTAPAGDETVRFQRIAAAADVWLRLGGVPQRAPQLELFGGARLRTTIGARIDGGTPTGSPRRPRARGQHAEVTVGAIGWPRALRHVLAVGGELGWAIDPLFVESKVDLPSYVLHGPIGVVRLEAQLPSGVLRFVVRPFAGVAMPSRSLQNGGYRRAAAQFGVSAQLVVRAYGMLHAFCDFTERHTPLSFGRTGKRDDYERAVTLGLMIRAPMDPMEKNGGTTR